LKPAKVAFLLQEFPTLTETFILNQIIFLIRNNIDVRIFALYPGDFSKLHLQYQGYGLEERLTVVGVIPKKLTARITETWSFFKFYGLLGNLGSFFKMINPFSFGAAGLRLTHFLYYTKLFEIQSCDLIHAHFGQMGSFFSRYVAKGLLNSKPYLVSFHGFDLVPSEYLDNQIRYHNMFQTAKIFTVNSMYTGKLLDEVNADIDSRVRLLPESLDTRLFEKKKNSQVALGQRKFKLVFVGRLVDWKGSDTAIRIVEKVVKDLGFTNLELSIIGRGPLFSQLEMMVEEKGLSWYIKLLGGQEQSVVKSILAEAHLFIYTGREQQDTNRAENQGLVLMEAQAMGLPVVAFDVGGVSEGVHDHVTGLLVSPGQVEEFAIKIVELLLDSEKREAMGEAARSYVCDNYDMEVLGQRLLDIYSEVIS
jgi:colanic acid/amylovoran biosynthesis glycosyltransferase